MVTTPATSTVIDTTPCVAPPPFTAVELRTAACAHLPTGWWFPERGEGTDNHGALARGLCAACPLRERCLEAAVARSEPHGIWGAAGEGRRRVLRRAWRRGADAWAAAAGAHWRSVDGCPELGDAELLAGRAAGGCGRASTYGRGCRCGSCSLAKALDAERRRLRQGAGRGRGRRAVAA